MLGICRGSQILNVFFGGTLIQDVKTKFHNLSERHMTPQEEGLWYVKAHPVKIEPDSKFAQIVGKTEIEVNSAHHQMVDTTGEKVKVVAKSPEGVHEAIEYTGNDCFIMGVQWHPEQLSKEESSKNIFKAFADAL